MCFFLRPVFIESKTTGPSSIKIIPIVSFRFFEGLLLRFSTYICHHYGHNLTVSYMYFVI